MTEIRRLLFRPAVFCMWITVSVISLFFTVRQEHAKWETAAAVLDTDADVLRTEYIRQIKSLQELDIHAAYDAVLKESKAASAEAYSYTFKDYIREVYTVPGLKTCTDYNAFLMKVRENAESYQKISLFSEENSFTLRNIRKTDADYQRAAEVQPELRVLDSITDILTNPVPDVMILFFCLFFVFLIPVERRNHLWDLLHTTAGGRGKLFFLRFLTMLPTVLFTMTAAYLPSFLYLSSLYGLPDLGICAQSEEVFSELAYPLSLGSFLAVLLSVRFISFLGISLLFWFFLEILSSSAFSAVLSGFVFLFEYLFYRLIPYQSTWVFFRVVNVFSCLDTVNIYGRYLNLNIFGFPVSASLCSVLFMIIIILGSTAGISDVYRRKRPQERSRVLVYLEDLLYKVRDHLFIRLPRFALGIYKSFIIQHGLLVLVLLLLGVFQLLPDTRAYISGAEYLASAREEELAAPFNDPETTAFFQKESTAIQQAYREYEEKADQYTKGELDELDWFMEDSRMQGIRVRQEALNILESKRSRLERLYQERGIRGWILDPQCYEQILGEGKNLSGRYLLYAAAAVITVCLLICSAFSYEKKSGVHPMLRLTEKGRLQFFYRKELLALIYAIMTVLSLYLPDLVRVHELYPIHALDAPVQSLSWMEDVRASFTIRTYLKILTIYRVFMLFMTAQPVLLISGKTKEPRISAVLAAGTLGITTLLYLIPMQELQFVNMAFLMEGRVLLHQLLTGSIPDMLILCGWMILFSFCAVWSSV